jgi:hypothetical protein
MLNGHALTREARAQSIAPQNGGHAPPTGLQIPRII